MTISKINVRIIELTLAEKRSEKRIKVRLKKEDQKLIMPILKKDFRITHTREVMKESQ